MTKKQRTSGDEHYLLIPESVIKDPRFRSLSEAAVYSLILGFSRRNELLRGGQSYIAGWTRLSRERVNRILSSLEARGLIIRVPLEQHGCMIRYGYTASGCTSENPPHAASDLSSLAACEVPGEISSQKTCELSSHRNTIEKSKSKCARARAYRNPFNDFEQHDYDFDEIERILTQ